MKKFLKYTGIIVLLLIVLATVGWFAGPKATFEAVDPALPELNVSLEGLDEYIASEEALYHDIKVGSESRIIWADSIRQTEYALVYLHGFSAGPMEGAPLHQEVASRYGMNLYLPRLSQHATSNDDAYLELTPKGLVESAKEALVIGKKLGKKVILMSCSTGGTLGIYLSAYHPDIHAHIMFSPNLDIFDDTSDLMTGPWGVSILKSVLGDYREPAPHKASDPDSVRQLLDLYWTPRYRVEGLVALQALLEQTMTEDVFKAVELPYFMGFYYKNEAAQDSTVKVSAMKVFDDLSSTPDEMKTVMAFPEAGSHVINSDLTSRQFEEVREETFKYIEEILDIQ